MGQVTGLSGLAICRPPADDGADDDPPPDEETAGAPELAAGVELAGEPPGVCDPQAASVSMSAGPPKAPNARPRSTDRRRIGVERRGAPPADLIQSLRSSSRTQPPSGPDALPGNQTLT